MRSIVAGLIILAVCFTASAQSKSDLRNYFEGKQLKLRIDVPVKDGVDVYPERSQSFDYSEYGENLKAMVRRSRKAPFGRTVGIV